MQTEALKLTAQNAKTGNRPEQIQGQWHNEGRSVTVCHATAYIFIYSDPVLHK